MKKNFAILLVLLAIAFRGFAQDTITGTVSRVTAPYFEQNVCNSRFALTADGETYYVMVDNYWPNPYLEDLVIHYDTIPVGNEIEVVGTIMEMEDGNGDGFKAINIQKLFNAVYSYGTGYIDWVYDYASIKCNVPPNYACFIAINGELQSEQPIVFNGMALGGSPYTMIGTVEIWPDYELPVLELSHVIPYAVETTATGVFVASNELCLVTPCGEQKYLSWADENGTHYLTNKDELHDEHFFGAIWGDHVNSTIKGFGSTHYDLFGEPFQTFETISMETTGERSIQGQIRAVTNPSTGIPVSLGIAICEEGNNYFTDNLVFSEYAISCVFDGDTIQMDTEVTAKFSSASLLLGRWLTPHFNIHVDEIQVNSTAVYDVDIFDFVFFFSPSNGFFEINSQQPIKSILVCDYTGRVLLNTPCNSRHASFDLKKHKGLALVKITFKNGQTVSKKVVL